MGFWSNFKAVKQYLEILTNSPFRHRIGPDRFTGGGVKRRGRETLLSTLFPDGVSCLMGLLALLERLRH